MEGNTRQRVDDLKFEEVLVGKPPPLRIGYTSVPTTSLVLDPDNPRLRYQQKVEPRAAIAYLFEHQDTKHLKADILANGLFERPFVFALPGDRFSVFEGNRRAACFIKLHEEFPDDPQWEKMPVRVLPEGASPEQRAAMLAQFHVTGKLDWTPHERAGHIYHMSVRLNMPDDTIKSILHMGKPAIDKAAAAYKMMVDDFCTIDNGKYAADGEGKFSYFSEFQKSKQLRDHAAAEPNFVNEFCRWVGEERLRAEDVRELPSILADPRAERMFTTTDPPKDAIRRAIEVRDRDDAARKSNVFRKLKELVAILDGATMGDSKQAGTDSGRQILKDVRSGLDNLAKHGETLRL